MDRWPVLGDKTNRLSRMSRVPPADVKNTSSFSGTHSAFTERQRQQTIVRDFDPFRSPLLLPDMSLKESGIHPSELDDNVTRHLCLSNLPIDRYDVPWRVLEACGDIEFTYFELVGLHGLLAATYYHTSHAQDSYNALTRLIQRDEYNTIQVSYVTEERIAALYHQFLQKKPQSLVLPLHGESNYLRAFDLMEFLKRFGNIRTFAELQRSATSKLMQVEFYDERVAKEVSDVLHNKTFQGTTFDIRPYADNASQTTSGCWPRGFNSRLFFDMALNDASSSQSPSMQQQGMTIAPTVCPPIPLQTAQSLPSATTSSFTNTAVTTPLCISSFSSFVGEKDTNRTVLFNQSQQLLAGTAGSSSQSLFSHDLWSCNSSDVRASSCKIAAPSYSLQEVSGPSTPSTTCKPDQGDQSMGSDNTFDVDRVEKGLKKAQKQ
ncbi:hypothetical protein EC973_001835 [Apophysomyces ossiformis]|uniref:Uncharacterized protein n=1 Tax=Apophysomyces ossiformis TaxID=679940 RepID=A0A8H7BHF4_9FUNG|nr:hypothetical protein EC973_001835 [Apophysomyces ossiformis]